MTILRFNATAMLHNAIGPIKTEGSSSAFPHTSTPSIEASKAISFVAENNNFFSILYEIRNMKISICIILFIVVAYELDNVISQRWGQSRQNRSKQNQNRPANQRQVAKSQRLNPKGSRDEEIPKPRRGKQSSDLNFDRPKQNKRRPGSLRQAAKSQRFKSKGSRDEEITKPRRGKQNTDVNSNRPKQNQKRPENLRQSAKSQRFKSKGSRAQAITKPRRGKESAVASFNRQNQNQKRPGNLKQATKQQRLNSKGSRAKAITKPRGGKQSAVASSRMACDFASHYVTDNFEFFANRTDGLFGEDWAFDNGCENSDLGCCEEDEDCKCFGVIEEMDEELEIPPICYPLNRVRNMAPPQFCMRRPQRPRRPKNQKQPKGTIFFLEPVN